MKMLKYALGAVLSVSLAAPAMAQNFPDVPDNHWAYEALSNLRNKVLFGYPDGLYRGNRPMSRYEFAVAINQLYQMSMGKVAGLEDQLDAMARRVAELEKKPAGADHDAAIAALKRDIAALKNHKHPAGDFASKADVNALKKLAGEFERELAELGVDVDAMKKDVADIDERLRAVEARKPAIDVSGELNLLGLGGHATDDHYGIMPNLRFTGVGQGDYFDATVGMGRDLTMLHELALTFAGTNDEGPQWSGTVVVGNMFEALSSSASESPISVESMTGRGYNSLPGGGYQEMSSDVYLRNLSVAFDGSLLGAEMSAELGRVGHKVGYYLFQRPDYTPEYKNEDWDNGKHYFDGGILTFNFGDVDLNVFGGRNSDRETTDGNELNSIPLASAFFETTNADVDQSLGFDLNVPLGNTGDLKLAYLFLDSNTVESFMDNDVNRNNVFGAELHLQFDDVKLFGAFSQTDLSYNTSIVNDEENTAWHAALMYEQDNWGIGGGYREVDPYFFAPGDWGRAGIFWNPSDVEGYHGHLWFAPSKSVEVFVHGQQLNGHEGSLMLNTEDEITSIIGGVNFNLNDAQKLRFSYEDTTYDWYGVGDDDYTRWFHVGFDQQLGNDAEILFGYTFSDARLQEVLGADFKGGLLSTQVRIKF